MLCMFSLCSTSTRFLHCTISNCCCHGHVLQVILSTPPLTSTWLMMEVRLELYTAAVFSLFLTAGKVKEHKRIQNVSFLTALQWHSILWHFFWLLFYTMNIFMTFLGLLWHTSTILWHFIVKFLWHIILTFFKAYNTRTFSWQIQRPFFDFFPNILYYDFFIILHWLFSWLQWLFLDILYFDFFHDFMTFFPTYYTITFSWVFFMTYNEFFMA